MPGERINVSKWLRTTPEKKVVVLADEIRTYVPREYYDNGLAREYADRVDCFGILRVGFVNGGKETPARLDLGVMVGISFSSKWEETADLRGEGPEKHQVLSSKKGETYMETVVHEQSHTKAKRFMDYVTTAKLPTDIPYREMVDWLKRNFEINGVSMGVSSVVVEATVAELMRDGKDRTVPFRIKAGRTGRDDGYRPAKLTDLPAINSTFSGLAFERIKDSVRSGVAASKDGRPQKITPMERLLLD